MEYSIIMPIYLREEAHRGIVLDAIHSIRESDPEAEFIIVNDGSPLPMDDINPLVDRVISHSRNRGISTSWNDGIRAAKGEMVVVVNDDIKTRVGSLHDLTEGMQHDVCVVAPGISGDGQYGVREDRKWFPGYCFLLPRKTIDIIGYFDEQFSPFNYEDTDYWVRILQKGGKLIRNFDVKIDHVGGDVLHKLQYDKVSVNNLDRFIAKHGFDPRPAMYYGEKFPWEHEDSI